MKYGISHLLSDERIRELYAQHEIVDEELDEFTNYDIADLQKRGIKVCILYEEHPLFNTE